MQNITTSLYQGLYNVTQGQIESNPNSVIISDNDNNITSTKNINGNIDDQTLNPNKIDFSNTITQNITTSQRIFNTNFALVPTNNSEYCTKYYVDSKGGTGGTLTILFHQYLGSGTINLQNNYYTLINGVYDVNIYITGNFTSAGPGVVAFAATFPYTGPATNEILSGVGVIADSVPTPLSNTNFLTRFESTRNNAIISIIYTFAAPFTSNDIEFKCQFKYNGL